VMSYMPSLLLPSTLLLAPSFFLLSSILNFYSFRLYFSLIPSSPSPVLSSPFQRCSALSAICRLRSGPLKTPGNWITAFISLI
jgi:hypothetical protein